jgi:hypothetical protein
MVATSTPSLNEGNKPPLCQVVGVKHTTAGGHLALRGGLKARPQIVVDKTEERDHQGKAGREML